MQITHVHKMQVRAITMEEQMHKAIIMQFTTGKTLGWIYVFKKKRKKKYHAGIVKSYEIYLQVTSLIVELATDIDVC